MELSEFVFRLLLIFTPGLISFFIIKTLTTHKEYKLYEETAYSFLLGWIAYFAYFLLIKHSIIFTTNTQFFFWDILTHKDQPLNFQEILNVSVVSFVVGITLTFLINHGIFYNMAKIFHISYKFADLSVFNYVMNTSSVSSWVVIRDLKNDHTYQGWVAAYPNSVEENGIFLRDVVVYKNSTGTKLLEAYSVFIDRESKDLIFEFPKEFFVKQSFWERIASWVKRKFKMTAFRVYVKAGYKKVVSIIHRKPQGRRPRRR